MVFGTKNHESRIETHISVSFQFSIVLKLRAFIIPLANIEDSQAFIRDFIPFYQGFYCALKRFRAFVPAMRIELLFAEANIPLSCFLHKSIHFL